MPQVFVSIGSNIERDRHIRNALDALGSRFGKLIVSPVYESVAVGFTGDSFYNLVVAFDTDESVGSLAHYLKTLEAANERQRDGSRYSSRTLDLDILLYDDLTGTVDGVELPRQEITQYAFVLRPLQDIAPQQKHPELDLSYQQLWQQTRVNNEQQAKGKELWPIDFDWRGQSISKANEA